MPVASSPVKLALFVAVLCTLSACADAPVKQAAAPNHSNAWWSDQYLSMVQDASDHVPASAAPAPKPIRMKIF